MALPPVILPDAVKILADITFAPVMLPPDPAPVVILPAVMLPDAVNVLADTTFALLILPPDPDDIKLLTVVLPEMFSVPEMLAPVPVTTTILALPTADILTLPFAAGILTLLLPFTIELPALTVIPVNRLPFPVK